MKQVNSLLPSQRPVVSSPVSAFHLYTAHPPYPPTASGSILRPLLLPTSLADPPTSEPLLITLNDALPSSLDPTSVGLQSWGSSIILSKLICLNPTEFGVPSGHGEGSLHRTLELGAGTGLLSLVWKGMSERMGATGGEVVATDFHEVRSRSLICAGLPRRLEATPKLTLSNPTRTCSRTFA